MRPSDTYRSERREAWRADPRRISWPMFNKSLRVEAWDVAPSRPSLYAGMRGRSKYMPHQSTREMARRVRQQEDRNMLMTRSTAELWKQWHAA